MQMEELTALKMREELREYLKPFRGCSVYFSEEDDSLFYIHLASTLELMQKEELFAGLAKAGYVIKTKRGKYLVSPGDELISRYSRVSERNCVSGVKGCCSARLMLHPSCDLMTQDGRRLIIDTLKIGKDIYDNRNNDPAKNNKRLSLILMQIKSIRQRAAVLLRKKENCGFYETGVFLNEVESMIFPAK